MDGVYFGIESFYFCFFFLLFLYIKGCQGLFAIGSQRKKYILACFLLLFLMAALRGVTNGGDLKRYIPEFHTLASSSFEDIWKYGNHELGYMIYIKLLSMVSDSDRCFIVGTSFISLIGPFYLFYRYSKYPDISILLYYAMGYYTNTFNNVRQSIAISIFFLIIPFLIDRKLWKYLIGVIIATLFHNSAIIMLFVYPLVKKPLESKKIFIYACAGIGFVLSMGYFFLSYIVQNYFSRWDAEDFSEDAEGTGYVLFYFYAIVFLLFYAYYILQKHRMNAEQLRMVSFFVVFQMFAMIIQFSAPIFHSMVRMTLYFFIPVVTIGVPYVSSMMEKENKRFLYSLIFSFAIFMMIQVYSRAPGYNTNSQGVIPYVFIDTPIF